MGTPLLSLILCSRNDAYLGNSRWRLETALNYVSDRVQALRREADVEVLVADWGSEVPLSEVIALTPAAARIVSFLPVPPALARTVQGDSPFPEVLALNAAARRARGQYIGRIDQDTLVGERFLRWFCDMVDRGGATGLPGAPEQVLLFANRRSLPYRLSVRCPSRHVLERFIAAFGSRLRVETGRVFYNIDVGIWLAHRNLWAECGGYDERMIYMNDMEIDMVTRLMSKYPMIDLGKLVGYDFYHLDHYHPRGSRSSSTHRKVNAQAPLTPAGFRPSGSDWGLAAYPLDVVTQSPERVRIQQMSRRPAVEIPVFVLFAAYTGVRTRLDHIIYPFYPVWRRRAAIAWTTIRGRSVLQWPGLLWKIWIERPSVRGPVT